VIALFWDIDGTLLTTARAGIASLEDALEQVTGVRVDLEEATTAGLTDYAIAEAAVRAAGVEPSEPVVMEFLRVHGEQLEGYLGRRRGHLMPGVREILEDLADRDDVVNLLLTGNIEAGAWAKLRHYGLDRFFPHGGAFCAGPGERSEIARRARDLADGAHTLYVIGDTPHDIAAGEAIGARAIAVATGSYDAAALEEHSPWQVFTQLPEPAVFRRVIELDG
jgi:phosphoglycolate phosphatase-like HAD superfamily hydrolase